ncbi:MAG: DNA repair protein RadC [Bacteroidetes bacterium]|nr:DNA repair protein RadC [Bacteroidota bacterium]
MLHSYLSTKNTIKDWSEQDRPREKLLLKGRKSLSDSELLAIIIGSGSANESALDLSKRIMASVDNKIDLLSKISYSELLRFKGIGPAKAINILSVLEMASRINNSLPQELDKITCSEDIFSLLKNDFADLQVEEFWLVLLNTANRVIDKRRIGIGGVSGVVADVKVIMKHALDHMASSIIIAHNHPSHNKKASKQDVDLTHKVKDAARLMDISLLDHLIFCGAEYFSFADEGIL